MNVYIIYQQKLSFECFGKNYDYGYIRIFSSRQKYIVFFIKTIKNYTKNK